MEKRNRELHMLEDKLGMKSHLAESKVLISKIVSFLKHSPNSGQTVRATRLISTQQNQKERGKTKTIRSMQNP